MAKKKSKKTAVKIQIFLIISVLVGILFSAISMILAVGMIPTLVAVIVDRTEGKMRSLTIGLMNFAGCVPFVIEVFKKGNSVETAITYIVEPRTIVVIYFAAAMGYLIDWAMTGLVSSLVLQKTKNRMKEIEKIKSELVGRWGIEVTGTIPLDQYGFPKGDVVENLRKTTDT